MEVRWRKASPSAGANNCVELGSSGAIRDSKNPGGPALDVSPAELIASVKREVRWRKASRSEGANNCVELGSSGAIRDSKNPDGPALIVSPAELIASVKRGRLG